MLIFRDESQENLNDVNEILESFKQGLSRGERSYSDYILFCCNIRCNLENNRTVVLREFNMIKNIFAIILIFHRKNFRIKKK
ncbi:MAG: hypothetical protein Ct9H90mP18_03050 [Gammaproteobacteria bacterium]|nr:MAG: hypothetical protein Ct9H90mP18_03050 [Gammaproteobacteria bacterium]